MDCLLVRALRPPLAVVILLMAAGVLLACPPLQAFLIAYHRQITEAAIASQASAFDSAARQAILQGSIDADVVEGGLPFIGDIHYDPRFHCDNEFSYQAVMANYLVLTARIDRLLALKNKDRPANYSFGKLLHEVEDFYAHSNYVPLYRDYLYQKDEQVLAIPPMEEVFSRPKTYSGFIAMLRQSLHTGRYPMQSKDLLPSDTDHGYPVRWFSGMNQDSQWRPFFHEADETAKEAATWYVELYAGNSRRRAQWAVFESSLRARGH